MAAILISIFKLQLPAWKGFFRVLHTKFRLESWFSNFSSKMPTGFWYSENMPSLYSVGSYVTYNTFVRFVC